MKDIQLKELNSKVYRRKCFLINLMYFIVIAAAVVLVVRYAFSALIPFVIAAIVSAVLRPVLRFTNKKLHLPRKLMGIFLILAVYLCIALLGFVVIDRVFEAIESLVSSLPSLWNDTLRPVLQRLGDWLTGILAQVDIEAHFSITQLLNSMGSDISSLSTRLLGIVGNFAYSLPSLLINIIICIVSTFFMLFDWDNIRAFFYRQLSNRQSELAANVTTQSASTIKQFIVSYGLILLITFTELSVGLLIIGIDNALLIALLIAVFDILPIVGCGAVLIPWFIISFVIGNTANGIGIAMMYIIITVVRNVVEPKIVGKQVGLHPLVTIMSMVVGTSLFGGIGLFGLPITLSVINKLNKEGVIHMFNSKPSSKTEQAAASKAEEATADKTEEHKENFEKAG